MLHKYNKLVICVLLLFGSILTHAQDEDPGTDMEDEYGNIDDSALEAPIDQDLLFLGVAGIALAFYRYRISNPATHPPQKIE